MNPTQSTMADLAVRAARAEIERDQLQARLDDCQETLSRVTADKPLTLFGRPPEYWLELERKAGGTLEEVRRDEESD